jgi:hypothetical protein
MNKNNKQVIFFGKKNDEWCKKALTLYSKKF